MQVNFDMDDQSGLMDFLVNTAEIANVILEPSLNDSQSCTNSIIYIKPSTSFTKQSDQVHLHLRTLNMAPVRPIIATITVNTHSTIKPRHKSFKRYETLMRDNIIFDSHIVDDVIKFRIKTSQAQLFPPGKINKNLVYSFTVGILCQMTKDIMYVTTDWLKIKTHVKPRSAVGDWTAWKSTMQPDRIITLEKQVIQLQGRLARMEKFMLLVRQKHRKTKTNVNSTISKSKKRIKLQHI